MVYKKKGKADIRKAISKEIRRRDEIERERGKREWERGKLTQVNCFFKRGEWEEPEERWI